MKSFVFTKRHTTQYISRFYILLMIFLFFHFVHGQITFATEDHIDEINALTGENKDNVQTYYSEDFKEIFDKSCKIEQKTQEICEGMRNIIPKTRLYDKYDDKITQYGDNANEHMQVLEKINNNLEETKSIMEDFFAKRKTHYNNMESLMKMSKENFYNTKKAIDKKILRKREYGNRKLYQPILEKQAYWKIKKNFNILMEKKEVFHYMPVNNGFLYTIIGRTLHFVFDKFNITIPLYKSNNGRHIFNIDVKGFFSYVYMPYKAENYRLGFMYISFNPFIMTCSTRFTFDVLLRSINMSLFVYHYGPIIFNFLGTSLYNLFYTIILMVFINTTTTELKSAIPPLFGDEKTKNEKFLYKIIKFLCKVKYGPEKAMKFCESEYIDCKNKSIAIVRGNPILSPLFGGMYSFKRYLMQAFLLMVGIFDDNYGYLRGFAHNMCNMKDIEHVCESLNVKIKIFFWFYIKLISSVLFSVSIDFNWILKRINKKNRAIL